MFTSEQYINECMHHSKFIDWGEHGKFIVSHIKLLTLSKILEK